MITKSEQEDAALVQRRSEIAMQCLRCISCLSGAAQQMTSSICARMIAKRGLVPHYDSFRMGPGMHKSSRTLRIAGCVHRGLSQDGEHEGCNEVGKLVGEPAPQLAPLLGK